MPATLVPPGCDGQHCPGEISLCEKREVCGMRDYRVKPIDSLSRGLAVLQVLQEARAASLHDLHLATGISKPTLTRILKTAHQHGLVWQRMVDGAFLPSHTLQRRGGGGADARGGGGAPPPPGGASP